MWTFVPLTQLRLSGNIENIGACEPKALTRTQMLRGGGLGLTLGATD